MHVSFRDISCAHMQMRRSLYRQNFFNPFKLHKTNKTVLSQVKHFIHYFIQFYNFWGYGLGLFLCSVDHEMLHVPLNDEGHLPMAQIMAIDIRASGGLA